MFGCCRSSRKLSLVIVPMMHSSSNTSTRPRLRTQAARRRGAHRVESPLGARMLGGASTRARSSRRHRHRRFPLLLAHAADPSMIMSSTSCSSISAAVASWMTVPSRITSTRSDRPEDLGHLAGDQQRRRDLRRRAVGSACRSRPCPDVDTTRRFVEQQQARAAKEPASQHDLLLVAAGQGAGEPRRFLGPHLQ